MKDTIIVVGVTREDSYGNLWVTPKGGGDEVKIGVKRKQLHELFEQGKAILLHYETYKNIPYVADAKPVEGELPPPTKPGEPLPEQQAHIDEALESVKPKLSDKDMQIFRSVGIKGACLLVANDKIGIEDMGRWADRMVSYVIHGTKKKEE